jgi:hypothetical protein
MRISNPHTLPINETVVNPGIKSWDWEKHSSHEFDVRKALVVSNSRRSEEQRLYNLL